MTERFTSFLLLLLWIVFAHSSFGQSGQFKWVNGAGNAEGTINSVAYSSNGDFVYVGGNLKGNPGVAYPLVISGVNGQDGFVAKFTSSGTLVWVFSVGKNGIDDVSAVAVDANDNVVVGGTFEGNNAEFKGTSGGSSTLSSVGAKDAFIAKYDASGVLMWLRQGTSTQDDFIHEITVDGNNDVYIAGSTLGSFNYYGNTITSAGGKEAFAIKVLSNGNFSWINSAGSSGTDEMLGVTVVGGKAYFGGHYNGLQLSTLSGTLIGVLNLSLGTSEMFINKYDAITGNLELTHVFGGSGNDRIKTLSNDGTNIFFSGNTINGLTIGSSSYSNTYQEIISGKLDVNLNPIWSHSTSHSSVGNADVGEIACLPNGRSVITGNYTGNLITGLAPGLTSSSQNGLILFYNATGVVEDQNKFFGAGNNLGSSVVVKNNKTTFLGGVYEQNSTFPNIAVSGNNSFKHPFLAAFGCIDDTAKLSAIGPTTVCAGQPIVLKVDFVGTGPFSGSISNGTITENFTSISSSSFSVAVYPAVGTSTFTITSFNSFGCGQVCAGSVNVIVYPAVANNVIFNDTMVCNGGIPFFTGTLPTGGNGGVPVYLWQYNQTSNFWFNGTNLPNNLQNYTSVTTNVPRNFRRIVTMPGCPSDTSNVVQVTIQPVVGNNTISANDTICAGSIPDALVGSLPTGGDGSNYFYTWERSPDNSVWTNVGSAINYAPGALSSTSYYRRRVTSGLCSEVSISNVIVILVYQPISNNTISIVQSTICSNNASAVIDGSVPINGSGTYTYSWEKSPNGISWSPAIGNFEDFAIGGISQSTYFRRIASSGLCGSDTSASLLITVSPFITSNDVSSSSQTICYDSIPNTLIGAVQTPGTFGFQWLVSSDDVIYTTASGTFNQASYSPGNLVQNTHYKRIIKSGACPNDTSVSVEISVLQNIVNNAITGDTTVCNLATGIDLTGSTPTGGNGTYTYLWQSSLDGVTFNTAPSPANLDNYSIDTASVTRYYRRIAYNDYCPNDSLISNTVLVTVHDSISNNDIAANQTVCASEIPAVLDGNPATGGNGVPSYLWQYSLDSISWINAATSEDYVPGTLTDTTYFRRTVVSGACIDTNFSNVVVINLQDSLTGNFISSSQVGCSDNPLIPITGLIVQGGDNSPFFTWQMTTDTNTTWTNVANTLDYLPSSVSDTTYYRRTVVSGACTDTNFSNTVVIISENDFSPNTISANQTICGFIDADTLIGSTVTGGNNMPQYEWHVSTDLSFWSIIGTSQNYFPGIIVDTAYFRRLVTAGTCLDTSYSNILTIYQQNEITDNVISNSQVVCSNNSVATITGLNAQGGDGFPSYTWQMTSDTNSTWTNVANTLDYTPSSLSDTTYFRRAVVSGACTDTNFSNVVMIVSETDLSPNTISANQTLCGISAADTLNGSVVTGGNNLPQYVWQTSTDLLAWTGAGTGQDYFSGIISDTVYFRRYVTAGTCLDTSFSNVLTIIYQDSITNNVISSDQIICSDNSAVQIDGMSAQGGDNLPVYIWQMTLDTNSSWTNVANTEDYTPVGLTDTTYYRRAVVSGACLDTNFSNVVTLFYHADIADNIISDSDTLCVNYIPNTLTGLAATGGDNSPQYIWQLSLNLVNWTNVGTGQNHVPITITDTTYYRRLVVAGSCLDTNISNVLTLIYLDPLLGTNVFQNDTICSGEDASAFLAFSTQGGGGSTSYMYTWEQNTGGAWGPAIGNDSGITFDPPILFDTTNYRLIVSSLNCPNDTSNVVTVIVEGQIANNILTGPSIICSSSVNDTVFGLQPINGNLTYAYEWQISSDDAVWTTLPTSISQNHPIGTLNSGTYFRRIVTSGQCGNDTSASVFVGVDYFIDTNTISNDQTICNGATPQIFTGPAPTGTGFVYEWQYSTDNSTFSMAPSNANTLDYGPTGLTQTTYYRRVIESGVCGADTSNVIAVTVYDLLSNNDIFGDTVVCYGSGPITLIGTVPQGGNGNFGYSWESSIDGINFIIPLTGATTPNYNTGILTQSTYYRRIVTNVDCPNEVLISDTVLITVHSQLIGTFANLQDTLCTGDEVNASLVFTGDAPFTFDFTYGGQALNITAYNSTVYNINFTPSSSGFILIDSLQDIHGCTVFPTDTMYYRVVDYPAIFLGNETTVCDEVTFNPLYGTGTLDFSSPTLGLISNVFPQNYTTNTFGSHEFVLSETVEGCTTFDTMVVIFTEPVSGVWAGEDMFIEVKDSIVLEATSLLANETGVWTLISGSGTFGDTLDPNSVFSNLISGITILQWTVSNGVCPADSDQVILDIRNLVLPTGFSPNNDGANDVLEFAGREDIENIKVQIFDRWGGLVFEDDNYQNDWGGTSKSGENLPEDTYFMLVDMGERGTFKSYLIIRR